MSDWKNRKLNFIFHIQKQGVLSINVELQEKGLKRIYAATKWFDGVSTCVIDELIKTLLNIFFHLFRRNEISAETHLFMYVYAFLFYRLEGILAKLRKLKLCG